MIKQMIVNPDLQAYAIAVQARLDFDPLQGGLEECGGTGRRPHIGPTDSASISAELPMPDCTLPVRIFSCGTVRPRKKRADRATGSPLDVVEAEPVHAPANLLDEVARRDR